MKMINTAFLVRILPRAEGPSRFEHRLLSSVRVWRRPLHLSVKP